MSDSKGKFMPYEVNMSQICVMARAITGPLAIYLSFRRNKGVEPMSLFYALCFSELYIIYDVAVYGLKGILPDW